MGRMPARGGCQALPKRIGCVFLTGDAGRAAVRTPERSLSLSLPELTAALDGPPAVYVTIATTDPAAGVAAEYDYIDALFGERGIDWDFEGQALVHFGDRHFDRIDFRVGVRSRTLWCYITAFFGD